MTKIMAKPTKYKAEYCQLLIDHLAEGKSIEAFPAVIHVNRDTIYEWFKKHREFLDAKNMGLAHARLLFDKITMNAIMGKVPGFNATAWVFTMKNRFGWRDKVELGSPDDYDGFEFSFEGEEDESA